MRNQVAIPTVLHSMALNGTLIMAGLFGTSVFGEQTPTNTFQGVYTGRDGIGLRLLVTLRDDGCYRVEWKAGEQEKGLSRGRWKAGDDRIFLNRYSWMHKSGSETNHLLELKEFRVVRRDGRACLVPDWDYVQLESGNPAPASLCRWERDAPAPKLIPAAEVPITPIEELIANKARYKGKRVSAIGDYLSYFEHSVLRPPGSGHDEENCLWISNFRHAEWAKDEDVAWVDEGRIRVVGTLTYRGKDGRYGHARGCPAGIVDVEYFKLVEAPGKNGTSTNAINKGR